MVKGLRVRRLHKAFLRYHDTNNWPMLREALKRMGRADLIGPGKRHLVPAWQPAGTGEMHEGRRGPQAAPLRTSAFRTQHTGLPDAPRAERGAGRALRKAPAAMVRAKNTAGRKMGR